MWELWLSMYRAPAVTVADQLQIFDNLVAPATEVQLAQRLDLDPRGTRVLLDLLVALGLLARRGALFELTTVASTYLVRASEFYWGPLLALAMVQPLHDKLIHALTAKQTPARPSDAWAHGSIAPALAASVSKVMHCHSLPAAVAAAGRGSFDGVRRLLDVGGGSGCFSIALAQRDPDVRCTVMELAAVCDVARGYIAEGGVEDRVDTRAVDMFREDWPTGYDGVLFSNIFHDWNATTNHELARRAFGALVPGGKIFLHEMLLDGDSPIAAGFSVQMLLATQGRQYRFAELAEIVTAVGFVQPAARATYGRYSIVTAVKP
jgi:acetylserotonin N-methyltransferase